MSFIGGRPRNEPSARDRLGVAIDEARAARNRAQAAEQAADRGRAALDRACAALAAYAGVDEAVAATRAQALKNGSDVTELPRALVDGRRRQQAAQVEVDDAQRTLALLEQGEQQARQAASDAQAELRLAVDRVLQVEAAAVVARMRRHEHAAAADRVLAAGFLAIRAPSAPPVEWGLHSLRHEPIHAHLLDVAQAAGIAPGDTAWLEFRGRLEQDANAEFSPAGNGNG